MEPANTTFYLSDQNKKSDRIIQNLLLLYFVFGLALTIFYDTYLIGIAVGALTLLAYYSTKLLFPNKTYHHYVGSACFGIFMAQFIYQMHGLFEMHFTAFIGIIVLMTYQNWRVFIPLSLVVVVHHSIFAYIQYLGVKENNELYKQIYFTQLDYMDFQTFLFHAALYAFGTVIAGLYSYNARTETLQKIKNIVALEQSQQQATFNVEFANRIARGEFESDYTLQEGDKLGEALVNMRSSLKESTQREKEERFITSGLAQLGDIIRNKINNVEELGFEVIRFVVKHLNANQGAIFILQGEEEQYLEIKGCYAYERKKFLNKRIDVGEGLVGQCFQEKELIYMTKVPNNYTTITSGLGDATPGCIVLVPLKNNDTVEGVIEIASFRKFEQYELNFVQKVAESIASAIANVKVSERIHRLYEDTRQQTEELRAQEEEMRQNLEELQATQENQVRLQRELNEKQQALQQKVESSEFLNNQLNSLRKNKKLQQASLHDAMEIVTEFVVDSLQVSRASVWSYDRDQAAIFCEDLYERDARTHSNGTALYASQFPSYFRGIREEKVIMAHDAHRNPNTFEFSEPYLTPLHIKSLLDVPFFIDGQLRGVICLEHQFEQRNWKDEEVIFLSSVCDVITIMHQNDQIRKQVGVA